MHPAVDTIFHALLTREPEATRPRLIRYLPEAEQRRIQQIPIAPKAVIVEDFSNISILDRVHWSWFLPTLKSYSLQEQQLFLSCIEKAAAQALAAEIPCKLSNQNITPIGRSYLREVLLSSLIGPHDRLLPIDFLPPSPLNKTLTLSKNKLIALIDLLSMHDLSVEIRQIVETKMLKKIYSFLSEAQRQFLKLITAKHEVMAQTRIGLERWDGKKGSLQLMLHRKGLSRLATSLAGQDPSLTWYICHFLDIGRGSALFKLCKESRSISDLAVRQVEELLEYDL